MNEYIDKKQAIDRIASCYCMDCEHSNGVLCRACEHKDDMDIIDSIPKADVQPVNFVQNEVLNYLFNKEREAESMPYSDIRQERITTLREVIRYVEGIGNING